MKLTAFLLLMGLLQVNAKGVSQTVSLSANNLPLEQVFERVKQQTGYHFLYEAADLQGLQLINLSVSKMPIADFLAAIFKDQPLEYRMKGNNVVISRKAPVVSVIPLELNFLPIKGVITNVDGQPLEGATVRVKGKAISAVTNEQGYFELNADAGSTLIISHVSFRTKELKVNDANALIISLEKVVVNMDTTVIVSTGYQDIPKERVTGSFTIIDNKTLNQQTGTNILQRLDGVSSGVLFEKNKSNPNLPNSGLNISIRGISTINGPLDPLIVLDGFIYEGSIDNINPNDVDNINILKDAAAASIWGARAGNGVIVITTKRGKLNQQLRVSANLTATIQEKPRLNQLPHISSSDYIDVEELLFNKGYFDLGISQNPFRAQSDAVEIFRQREAGTITDVDSARMIDRLKSVDSRQEYLNHFYREAITQQYAVNVTGGSRNNAYTFGVAYDRNIGETYTTNDRLNIKVGNTFKPTDKLGIDASVYFTTRKSRSGRNVTYNSLKTGGRAVPYLRFTDDDGNGLPIGVNLSKAYTDTLGGGKLLDGGYYPLEDYKHETRVTTSQDFFANVGVNYKIASFLEASATYQYQQQEGTMEQLSGIESFNARAMINMFTQLDRNTGVLKYIVPLGGILQTEHTYIHSSTARGQLNLQKTWKPHSVAAIAGAEIRQSNNTYDGYTLYGYNKDPFSFMNVDFVNQYPLFADGGYTTISGAPMSGKELVNRFVSLYANGSYVFDERYTLSASVRKDGSNIFGLKTNDRWKPLYSIGAAWNISNESFYNASAIPLLKARITYGRSGNVDLTKTALAVANRGNGSTLTGFLYTRMRSLSNPELRWEQVATLNAAVEFLSRNSRIGGSIEYYHKKGSDLYGPEPVDYTGTGGFTTIVKNVANTVSKGIDVVVNTRNLDKQFKWNTTLLFNINSSKTTRYETTESKRLTSLLGGGTMIIPSVGRPLYAIAAFRYGGLDAQGNPMGFLDGQPSSNYIEIFSLNTNDEDKSDYSTIRYVGMSTPPVFGSLMNTFSYKTFSLSLNLAYKIGYYFYAPKFSSAYSAVMQGAGNQVDYDKRWQQSGDEAVTNVPAFIYPENEYRNAFFGTSDFGVLRADHIRLQYINVSYTLAQSVVRKSPFREIQLYANAANLGVIWRMNKEGYDPDYASTLPPQRTVSLGIRINY